MSKFVILIPVYNDWDSLVKLIDKINIFLNSVKNAKFDLLIVNDSSTIPVPDFKVPNNFNSIKIINMKENKGHARCNAFGIRYLAKNVELDYLILMDGDGEDRPEELELLVKKALTEKNKSIVAKRIKRSEGPFFRFLYEAHKILTLIFTGKKINFGNYSCITKKDAEFLSDKSCLWSSFSGTFKKHLKNYAEIESVRGIRYYGPSKMSLFKLGIHSFSIIAVFKYNVFIRSSIMIVLLSIFNSLINLWVIGPIQILIVIFNLIIFLVSLRENKTELLNSHLNVEGHINVKH